MTAFILGYAFGFSVGMAFVLLLWDSDRHMASRSRGVDGDAVVGGSRPGSRSL